MALTQRRLKELLHYDLNTGVFTHLRHVRMARIEVGDAAGYLDRGYVKISVDGVQYKGHRLAWLYCTGSWPAEFIDHANGDKSDNRFSNLRLATRDQNGMNIGLKSHNTSGYKGVSFYKQTQRWKAQIQVRGKKLALGYFDTAREAYERYIFAALEHHGEFARFE